MSDEEGRAAELETLEQFKNSFAYGTRTDLLFKFLKDLSGEAAAEFLAGLLTKVGESADDGDVARMLDHVYARQVRAYAPHADAAHNSAWVYESGPFTPLGKPLSDARVALGSSSGHFVAGDDPEPFGVKHMSQEQESPVHSRGGVVCGFTVLPRVTRMAS